MNIDKDSPEEFMFPSNADYKSRPFIRDRIEMRSVDFLIGKHSPSRSIYKKDLLHKEDASKNYERIMNIFNEKIKKLEAKNTDLQQELNNERTSNHRMIDELKV